jgi:NTP pyrophosphatase (non-canonical NTP hydrolase)
MDLNEYQHLAARTMNRDLSAVSVTLHALHGMSAEIGEIHSIYQKAYQGHEISMDDMEKELGDLLWFIAEFCTAQGWFMDDVCGGNIEKLKRRYPDGFDPERSVHRTE